VVNVKVARDGVEIGECRRQELDQLARAGHVLPTDHYWLEGMEEWRLLSDLLASKTWRPAAPRRISRGPVKVARDGVEIGEYGREELDERVHTGQVLRTDHYWREGMEEWQLVEDILNPDPWTPAASPPIYRARGVIVAAIGCLAAVAAGFAFYLLVVLPARLPDKPAPAGTPNPDLDRTDAGLRTRATTELTAKLNKLPNVATPPSYTFYDSLSITIPDPPASLTVTIRGTETAVSSDTREAISRADFVVKTDFRQNKWFFKYYHASANDLVHGTTTEIDRDDQYPIPPAIVSLLGLQLKSD